MDKPKFDIDFIQEHPREISFFLGEKLGSGCYRDVFDFFWNKNYVIKIAINTEGRQEYVYLCQQKKLLNKVNVKDCVAINKMDNLLLTQRLLQ